MIIFSACSNYYKLDFWKLFSVQIDRIWDIEEHYVHMNVHYTAIYQHQPLTSYHLI